MELHVDRFVSGEIPEANRHRILAGSKLDFRGGGAAGYRDLLLKIDGATRNAGKSSGQPRAQEKASKPSFGHNPSRSAIYACTATAPSRGGTLRYRFGRPES